MFFLLTLPFRLFFGLLFGVLILPFALLAVVFGLMIAVLAVVLTVMIPLLPIAFVVFAIWAIVKLASRPVLSH